MVNLCDYRSVIPENDREQYLPGPDCRHPKSHDCHAPKNTLSVMLAIGPGVTLGDRYLLEAFLGRGATGEVWQARDTNRGQVVALKLLLGQDRRGVWREATALTSLESPHILKVNNADMILDVPYIDAALARDSLDHLMTPIGLEPRRAIDAMRRTLKGLQLCHDRGLLHRDIKPANIFEDFRGDIRLGDFGSAEFMDGSGSAGVAGDPRVRAPEMWAGGRSSVASDIYASAVSLYALVSGEMPFQQLTMPDLERAITTGDFLPIRDRAPNVSRALAQVIQQGLDVDPRNRFRSASEFDSRLGALPTRSRHFAPTPAHPGHVRCWTGTGTGSDIHVCLADTSGGRSMEVVVKHMPAERRITRLCRPVTTATASAVLRRTFEQLA